MQDSTIKIGRQGEMIAVKYLEKKGYTIVEQNHRTKYSEMDLITTKKNVLVFVEVRTKTNERFGTPEETINKNKIRRLIRSAQAYVAFKKYIKSYRIDAVCVVLGADGKAKRISHHESIN